MKNRRTTEVCTCTVKCEAGNVNENCPLCEKSLRNCTAPEAVKTDTETPQEKPKSNMGSLMILLVLALAGGGAALYYFKFRKPKADTTGHDDLDEYDFGEDEDADEEPAEIENSFRGRTGGRNMSFQLVIAEKPSVARSIAAVIGAD